MLEDVRQDLALLRAPEQPQRQPAFRKRPRGTTALSHTAEHAAPARAATEGAEGAATAPRLRAGARAGSAGGARTMASGLLTRNVRPSGAQETMLSVAGSDTRFQVLNRKGDTWATQREPGPTHARRAVGVATAHARRRMHARRARRRHGHARSWM